MMGLKLAGGQMAPRPGGDGGQGETGDEGDGRETPRRLAGGQRAPTASATPAKPSARSRAARSRPIRATRPGPWKTSAV